VIALKSIIIFRASRAGGTTKVARLSALATTALPSGRAIRL